MEHFMYRGLKNKVMYVDHMGPHSVESSMDFFRYTFYAWLKLFGKDEQQKISFDYMYMCMKIQNPHTYLEFDFTSEIEKIPHNQLLKWKSTKSFRNHSLWYYLILYQNVIQLKNSIKLSIIDEEGGSPHFHYIKILNIHCENALNYIALLGFCVSFIFHFLK